MRTIQEYLQKKQDNLRKNHLFQHLKWSKNDLHDFARVSEQISFWVMSFQDFLRINLSKISDQEYYKFVRQHLMEDIGHEKWFLYDLKAMDVEQPNLQLLYSNPHTSVRDATYALMSEVFRANYDFERIALILTLESTGHIFFEYVADFVEKNSHNVSLKYFSNYHLDVEKNHECFEKEMQAYLNNIKLNHHEESQLIEMIDRVYEAFSLMFDGLAVVFSSKKTLALSI